MHLDIRWVSTVPFQIYSPQTIKWQDLLSACKFYDTYEPHPRFHNLIMVKTENKQWKETHKKLTCVPSGFGSRWFGDTSGFLFTAPSPVVLFPLLTCSLPPWSANLGTTISFNVKEQQRSEAICHPGREASALKNYLMHMNGSKDQFI
jgi:hypothetical protein